MNHKHGMSVKGNVNPTYNSWSQMLSRCEDPNSTRYKKYGGRGIKVCDRWHTFTNFLLDMEERPQNTTLDRKNSNKGYYKENCRWATKKQQANNRRNNVFITFEGRTLAVMQWADLLLITNKKRFHARICTGNWNIVRAATTPVHRKTIS